METIVCTPLFAGGWGGGGVEPLTKGGGLTWSQFLEGDAGKEGVTFFRGEGGRGCSFYIKNKLKSQMCNDRKSLSTKIFFPVTTKNLNWEILMRNLVTFKRWDENKVGLRGDLIFRRGVHKKSNI